MSTAVSAPIADAITLLRANGYTVFENKTPSGFVRPCAFARDTGLNIQTVLKRLAHPDCPQTERHHSPSGKLKCVRMSPDLFGFLAQSPTPGRKLRRNATTPTK